MAYYVQGTRCYSCIISIYLIALYVSIFKVTKLIITIFLEFFLKNWVDNHIKEILEDLLNLNKESVDNKYIRALMFQLFENNGVIKRELVEGIVKSIKTEERKKIWDLGIKIGRYHIFLPRMLKPKAVNLRISLWKFYNSISNNNEIPKTLIL